MWLEAFKISKMFSLFAKGNEVKWGKAFYVIRDTVYVFYFHGAVFAFLVNNKGM